MPLTNEPFTRYKLDEEKAKEKGITFTVYLNEEEKDTLYKYKEVLEQPKDSTTLKTLAWIGTKMLDDQKTAYILSQVFKNKRKNKRMGIVEYEQ